MVKVSGKAQAAGEIEVNVSGAIPAATALRLTIVVSFTFLASGLAGYCVKYPDT